MYCMPCVKGEQPDATVFDTGELPGDFGFDPLRLGENKEALQWYQQAELQNGRHVHPILPLLESCLPFRPRQSHCSASGMQTPAHGLWAKREQPCMFAQIAVNRQARMPEHTAETLKAVT